jgi:hypothetical protein
MGLFCLEKRSTIVVDFPARNLVLVVRDAGLNRWVEGDTKLKRESCCLEDWLLLDLDIDPNFF